MFPYTWPPTRPFPSNGCTCFQAGINKSHNLCISTESQCALRSCCCKISALAWISLGKPQGLVPLSLYSREVHIFVPVSVHISSRCSSFSPQSKDMQLRLTGDNKLPVAQMWICLLQGSTVMDWQVLFSFHPGTGFSLSTKQELGTWWMTFNSKYCLTHDGIMV